MLMVVVVGADEDGDHDQQHTAPADRAAPQNRASFSDRSRRASTTASAFSRTPSGHSIRLPPVSGGRFESDIPGIEFVKRTITVANVVHDNGSASLKE